MHCSHFTFTLIHLGNAFTQSVLPHTLPSFFKYRFCYWCIYCTCLLVIIIIYTNSCFLFRLYLHCFYQLHEMNDVTVSCSKTNNNRCNFILLRTNSTGFSIQLYRIKWCYNKISSESQKKNPIYEEHTKLLSYDVNKTNSKNTIMVLYAVIILIIMIIIIIITLTIVSTVELFPL